MNYQPEYDYDPFAEDEELESKPKPREPKLPRCIHCPDREVISDGKNGWVHNDDYKYSCDPDDPNTTFAEVFATGGVIHESDSYRVGER